MLRTRLLLPTVAALLISSACTSPRPVETAEERPSATKVAKEASDAAKAIDAKDLVLYSSSIDDAQAGADDGDRAGETEAEKPKEDPSAEKPTDDGASDGEQPVDDVDTVQDELEEEPAEPTEKAEPNEEAEPKDQPDAPDQD